MHILFLGYKVSDSLNPVKCFLVHLQFWVFFTWNFSKHPLSITQENFALFPLHIHFISLLFCSALLALPPLGVFHRPVCHPFTVHIGRCFPFPGSAKCSNQLSNELHSEVDLCPCNFSSTPCLDFVVWGLFHAYICIYNCQVHEKPHNKNFHHLLTYDRWSIASAVDQPDKYKFNLRYSQIHLMI